MMRIACFKRTPSGNGRNIDRFSKHLAWLVLSCGTMLAVAGIALATEPPEPPVPDEQSALPPISNVQPPLYTLPGPSWPSPPSWEYPIEPTPSTCSLASSSGGQVPRATTGQSVLLGEGAVAMQMVDLRLPGPGIGWAGVRTISGGVDGSDSLGGRWLANFTDYYLLEKEGDAVPYIELIVDASSKRVFDWDPMTGDYTGPADSPLTLVYDQTESEYILTNTQTGQVDIFDEFDNDRRGKLKEVTSLALRAAGKDGVVYAYDQSDELTQITTAEGQEQNIVFSRTGTKITKIEVRTGADTSTRMRQVEYTYFDSQTHSSDLGTDGDLVQVKLSALRTGGSAGTASDWIVRYTQYRYNTNGQLKAVIGPDDIERLISDRSDISSASAILAKGDDDDDNGAEDHKIKDYARQWFTYYATDVKTDNSGTGTGADPKCVTVWDASGEDLQTKYGGTNLDEVADDQYMVKSVTSGGCSSCGGGSGSLQHDFFYMDVTHASPDANDVVRLVVEDVRDGDDNGMRRTIYGLNDSGRKLRSVTITDPDGTPSFWCQSWKLETSGQKLNRMSEYRSPAAHNVSASTIDEFLDPSANSGSNDTTTLNASAGAIRVYAYNTAGDQTGVTVKQGRSGTAYYVSATDYQGGTNENRKHLVTARYSYPSEETSRTAATRITTQYAYTFWTGTDAVKTVTATLPTVSTSENGSGSATTTVEYYDSRGRLRWQKDAAGHVNYYSYHPENGQLAYSVRDADPTSLPTSADGNSTKWVASSDGSASSNKPTRGTGLGTALEQVSFQEYDSQGRATLRAREDGTDGTVLSRNYTVYETNRQLRFPFWDTSTNKPLLPIQVVAFDDSGTVNEQYAVDPARTAQSSGVPTGLASGTNQSHYLRWSRVEHDAVTGQLLKSQTYQDIPSTGYGTKDTNYAETVIGYDALGRRDRQVAPDGTITRTVFDDVGRVISQWVGTDDTPSSGNWSPTNNSGANMTKVAEFEYDDGNAGGNGNRTKSIQYVTDDVEANARVTKFKYDWRDRQTFVVDALEYSSKVTYARVVLDNMGRATKSERYYDADGDESFPTDGTVDGGDRLLGRSESLYDKLGRVYRTKTYAVDPDDGTVGSMLVSDTWRDALGRTIKQQSGGSEVFSKMVYDGLGRATKRYTGYDTDETAYGDADDVTGDTVLQQSETEYDASGRVIKTSGYARKHTASGTGALSTSTARVTYSASWYDDAGRQTASANYGTNGGSSLTRPSSAPSRSDTVLVSSTEYNTSGAAYKTTDPAGKESRREFDDAGRVTKTTDNYTDGNPATGSSDEDVTVEMVYNSSGKLTTLTAKNPTTGDQVTKYVYGTDTGGITPEIYRNDILRAEIYPDSDDTTSLGNGSDGTYDRIEYTYNIQGQRLTRKDQLGTVHTYEYDDGGRVTDDRVTTLGSGVDGAVRRVSTTYDIRGLREKISTYDNATVGSGNVVNEVAYEYNTLGRATKEYQEHEGAKDASTLYVGYNFDTSTSGGEYTKGVRPTSVRYPNGRLVHLTYGSSGSTGDVTNRVDAIKDDSGGSPGTTLSQYTYLGGRIVVEDYQQPDVKLNLDSGTAGTYAGLDRFGRVVDHLWYDYGASANRDQFTYGYDRASNRLYRENTPVSGKDEYYTYDDMNRLATYDRGDLNANKDAISGTPVKEEDWGLDMTGNWSDFTQKSSGSTDLDQDRTHNEVNEITAVSETTGTAWIDPVQDRAGNMTTVPKPSNLSSGLTCKWDAWNHLVEVKDGATVVAKYEYDGLARRVKKHVDSQSPGSPDGIDAYVHTFYNSGWQVLETRRSTVENTGPESLQPKYQYVWSLRYIDAAVLRDENTDSDSTCDDGRIYYLSDANFNVTTLVDTSGDAIERYVYSPYGVLTIYDATWSNIRSASSYDIEYTYTGRRLDPETGLYYYRHRAYAAQLGRFCSRDPIGYRAGDNLVAYVWDSPTTRTDGLGLVPPGTPTLGRPWGTRQEIEAVFEKISALCDCDCLECTKEECLAEARRIAREYVRVFYRRRRSRIWRFGLPNHYRCGWMCYQWQTIIFNELEPVVSGSKCFDIERVGLIRNVREYHLPTCTPVGFGSGMICEERGYYECYRVLQHNWVAISVVRDGNSQKSDDVPFGPCTVYLDPWKACGPGVFSFDDDHPQHNCVMGWCLGPRDRPTGAHYITLPEEGDDVTGCLTADEWNWWCPW